MKKISSFLILSLFLFCFTSNVYAQDFSDVPSSHWSYGYVNKLRELNITQGIGDNKFGLGQNISRAEFITFLSNLLDLQIISPDNGSFIDNQNKDNWYYSYIETALINGIITKEESTFRPDSPIKREEMAIMIVRSLGLDELAKNLDYDNSFNDVENNQGYIMIAKDLNIISGIGGNRFNPNANAKREEAATMMVRMYDIYTNKIKEKNAFYAINSNSQQDMIDEFDYISFGWSRLESGDGDIFLNTTSRNENEYNIPSGYGTPLNKAKKKLLMVAVKGSDSQSIINNTNLRNKAVDIIADAINNGISVDDEKIIFDGVLIDFETLSGSDTKVNFNNFLKSLRGKLGDKLIFTAVHPQRNVKYYDGYDFKEIGKVSDKVILMAHDYNAKTLNNTEMENNINTTPLAPIDEIYYALKYITDSNSGVEDKEKIVLQISFGSAQWKSKNNIIIHNKPYTPTYDSIYKRMASDTIKYSKTLESPYIEYYNSEDETDNIIWYEDRRSVEAKVNLSKLFNVNNLSIWRLGLVPDKNEHFMNVKDYLINIK